MTNPFPCGQYMLDYTHFNANSNKKEWREFVLI
jgi:hypothetical protein